MAYKAANNAYATLAVGMDTVATTLQVATGKGALFPEIVAPNHTYVTNENSAGDIEVMKVTAHALGSDSMTVVRAQDGTTAKSWIIGDIVEVRPCAAAIIDLQAEIAAAVAAHEAITTGAHAASEITYSGAAGLTAVDVEAALDELDTEKQPAHAILAALAALDATLGLLEQTGVDTFTKRSIASVGAGKHTIWIPARGMAKRSTYGAAFGEVETATAKMMLSTLDFDQGSAEYAQFHVRMPKGWDEGTVTAFFLWSNATGVGDVVWAIQGTAISDAGTLDTAWGSSVSVTDTASAGALLQSAESGAVTIGGTPAENDWVVFQVYRDAGNGSDTLAADARLHGVALIYTTNANTDA